MQALQHDMRTLRMLYQAYADHIEVTYLGLARQPGVGRDVVIRSFGRTRTFIAPGREWTNRAVMTGNESFETIDEILEHFDRHKTRCHIEWNPCNCYRTHEDPAAIPTWNNELLAYLLRRGFVPGGFRCVWCRDLADLDQLPADPPGFTIRSFCARTQADELAGLARQTGSVDGASPEATLNELRYAEQSPAWQHYIGWLDGAACCHAKLLVMAPAAYLEWGYTAKAFRRRGCHCASVVRRLRDAAASGCKMIFSVTDFNIPSARSLQKCGFHLAYNYCMLIRPVRAPALPEHAVRGLPE